MFKTKVVRTIGWAWRSTICLASFNVALLYLIANKRILESPEEAPNSSRDSESFHHAIDTAQGIFDFMRDQRLGKNLPPPLDLPAKAIETHACWNIPQRPNFPNNNSAWQPLHQENDPEMEAYIYASYLDGRPSHLFPLAKHTVQILAMARRFLSGRIFCQIWFGTDRRPQIVSSVYREIWQRAWDPRDRFYTPWLITCPVRDGRRPTDVSLAFHQCHMAPNISPVLSPGVTGEADQDKIVVCVKGMDFLEDNSWRLIEWLELQYILGADKVILYTYYVHPKTQAVISHYATKGRLVQVPLSLPGKSPNSPFQRSRFIWRNRQQKRRNEIIPYNDCLYRHLHTHSYLLIVDIDEAIVPVSPLKNWSQILTQARQASNEASSASDMFTAFSVRNAFFFDNLTRVLDSTVPEHLHMLRHNVRSKKLSAPGNYGKSFVYIPNVASVFNHFPLHKQRPGLEGTRYLSPELALKLHFKKTCPVESRDECPHLYHHTVKDTHLAHFAAQLIQNVNHIAKQLDLRV